MLWRPSSHRLDPGAGLRPQPDRDLDLPGRLWQEQLQTSPPWLFLDDVTLTTVSEWLDSPVYWQARDYHRGHAEILARRWLPSVTAAGALAVPWELKSVSRTRSTPLIRVVRKTAHDLEPRYGIEP
jgi:hypothetical protein